MKKCIAATLLIVFLVGCETDNRNNTNDIRPSTATEGGSSQGSPPKG